MEQVLNTHVDTPSGFLVAFRHLFRRFLAQRQHRRNIRIASRLPDHILRDIGHEELITRRTTPALMVTNQIC